MRSPIKYLLKAVATFTVLTIAMTIVWDLALPGRIYYCTDHVGMDYLNPGSWVHGDAELVEDVAAASSRSLSGPDIMLRGWTPRRLWLIWGLMVGSSIVVSCLLAGSRWPNLPSSVLNQDGQQAAP
jgi:hypothetical protein